MEIYRKKVEEFLNFFFKKNKNIKVTYERSYLKTPVWFIKYASESLHTQPAILRIEIVDDVFLIDDYRLYLKYNNFKDFKKAFIEIIESDNFRVKMRMLNKK